jgi:hypothetical protein
MVVEADRIRERNPRLALQLGVAALYIDPSPLTQADLARTVVSSRWQGTLTDHTNPLGAVLFSRTGTPWPVTIRL